MSGGIFPSVLVISDEASKYPVSNLHKFKATFATVTAVALYTPNDLVTFSGVSISRASIFCSHGAQLLAFDHGQLSRLLPRVCALTPLRGTHLVPLKLYGVHSGYTREFSIS